MSMPITSTAGAVPSTLVGPEGSAPRAPAQPGLRPEPEAASEPFRTALAEKIFLDRYSLKSPDKAALAPGDTIVYCPNPHESEKKRRREIGVVVAIDRARGEVEARLRDDPEDPPVEI